MSDAKGGKDNREEKQQERTRFGASSFESVCGGETLYAESDSFGVELRSGEARRARRLVGRVFGSSSGMSTG
ncbi:hypothetical protein GCK72_016322 [Caenorhabditis remanei]|uniref:Uncharacterized protein n=1 Tax=Caenorhabditis remanei TaxID=31234 RepID=A0A6A5GZ43_CAERE|nr:hypothetical protein GCK72_016322 [Caenorhabditis remanei]KAF1759855.1 hypothetical protein GCK72_016322 [Caenorhabditis remanei]